MTKFLDVINMQKHLKSKYLEMTNNTVLPRNKFMTLRKRNCRNKFIYQAYLSIKGSRCKRQHLMKCFIENKYVYHYILFVDSPYKFIFFFSLFWCWIPLIKPTNHLLLLEFIGVRWHTQLHLLIWWLRRIKYHLGLWNVFWFVEISIRKKYFHKVIVIGRDNALMNIVSTTLICWQYIFKKKM